MRAARKSGQDWLSFRSQAISNRLPDLSGRGRFQRAALNMSRTSRRVIVNARVVRHQGKRFRSAPMVKHLGYLQRDGVGQDGRDADLFGLNAMISTGADLRRAAKTTGIIVRFIISPEDAGRSRGSACPYP